MTIIGRTANVGTPVEIKDANHLEWYPVSFLHQKLIDILSPSVAKRKPNGMVKHNRVFHKGFVNSEHQLSDITVLCPTQLIRLAVAGDRLSIKELIKRLTPTIQISTAQTLSQFTSNTEATHSHAEIADYCQEIFMHLFENDCKVLRSWDPEKGMKLKSFISLITKRRVISSLRGHKTTNFLDEKIINEKINTLKTPDEQNRFIDYNFLLHVIHAIKETISEQGYEIFVLLFLYEQSVDEISEATGLTKNSIYVWKNRIRKQAKDITAEWESNKDNLATNKNLITSKGKVNANQ